MFYSPHPLRVLLAALAKFCPSRLEEGRIKSSPRLLCIYILNTIHIRLVKSTKEKDAVAEVTAGTKAVFVYVWLTEI